MEYGNRVGVTGCARGAHRLAPGPRPLVVMAEDPPLRLGCAVWGLICCFVRTGLLVARGRVRQPTDNVGRRVEFADGTASEVYRETVIVGRPCRKPAVLVVGFRLRHIKSDWAHGLFRVESELNTVLFAGFPGLVSKLWLCHDRNGTYRGLYQWDDPELAAAYARALWWVLALVSEPGSIHYAVLPGADRDEVLEGVTMGAVEGLSSGWWGPVRGQTSAT